MAFHQRPFQPKNFYLGKKFACHGVILSSQSIVFAQAIEYAYREQRKNQARPCIGEIQCNPPIPNIDDLISDTNTLFLSIFTLNSQCVGVAKEGIDVLYMGVITIISSYLNH